VNNTKESKKVFMFKVLGLRMLCWVYDDVVHPDRMIHHRQTYAAIEQEVWIRQ
jgi:hypothetical protein